MSILNPQAVVLLALVAISLACAPVASRVEVEDAVPTADDEPKPLKFRLECGGGDLGGATYVAYAPDGKTVYAGGPNGSLHVIDVEAAKKVGTLTADPPAGTVAGEVSGVAVSPDGKLVAAACHLEPPPGDPPAELGWELRLWDRQTGKLLARRRGDQAWKKSTPWELKHLAFGPDSATLAGTSWGYDHTTDGYLAQLFVWTAPGLEPKRVFTNRAQGFIALALLREGGADVALGWSYGHFLKWDVGTGKLLDDRRLPTSSWASALSPDGRSVANTMYRRDDRGLVVGSDVNVFDIASGKPKAAVQAHTKEADFIRFSPDGRTIATFGRDGLTILFDAETLAQKGTIHAAGWPAFSPDGKTLAMTWHFGPSIGNIGFYDVPSGRHKFTLGRHAAQVWSVAFSPDGKMLASSENLPVIFTWDPATGRRTGTIPLNENGRTIKSIAFSPDSRTLASVDGAVVKLFDPTDGKLKATLEGHTSGVNRVAFSPDGKYLASASGTVRWVNDEPRQDAGEVIVWDAETLKPVHTLKAHPAGTFCLAFSPDGRMLATGGGDGSFRGLAEAPAGDEKEAVRLWEVATGKPVAAFPCDPRHMVTALAFSPDGKTLAHTGIDGSRVRLLDLGTGKERASLHAATAALAFSPDGKTLATGSTDQTVKLWDVQPPKK
ncbi:MAG TPA: WD40 repeat domain-containing protein [Gemmataceae bacterium]|nr:WD40 repeat domain-containing protein [Gemmataceae bacterium]